MVSNRKEELSEAGKENKVTTSEDCELVTLLGVLKGRLEISRSWICFWDAGLAVAGTNGTGETGTGTDRERADFKFPLAQLQEVHLRRYNLRRSALEFFLTDHTNYFVNFTAKVLIVIVLCVCLLLCQIHYCLPDVDTKPDLQPGAKSPTTQLVVSQQPFSGRCSTLLRSHPTLGPA